MISLLALALFAACLAMLAHLVICLRPMGLGGALALAFTGFVALESIVLNVLSIFRGIDRRSVLAVHLVLLLVWLMWVLREDRQSLAKYMSRYRSIVRQAGTSLTLLSPLVVLIGLAALLHAPNNYDSLTYHMARVAHWLQEGSVGYYPTIIERQNVMGPGAEYVILFFQALTGSDRLAPLVQLFAYVLLLFAVINLSRLLRLPKAWSPAIVVLAASAPIAVMEASNTKNDLVAALMTLSMIIAARRLIAGEFRRMVTADFVLLGLAVATGYLVKPTSLLVAGPVIATGFAVNGLRCIRHPHNLKKAIMGVALAALAFAAVAGPDLYRKHLHQVSRHEVYSLFAEYTVDRLWNPVRVLAHNTPFPEATGKVLRSLGYTGDIITKDVFNLHEDMIGNPWQVSAFIVLSAITVVAGLALVFRRSLASAFLLSLSPLAAWGVFGLMVKDQGWITRLEMPLFFILPVSFVFVGHLARERRWLARFAGALLAVTAVFSLSHGVLVACKIPARPLLPVNFWGEKPGRTQTYYHNAPSLLPAHSFFLEQARKRQCSRIGLVMGPDSAEYPLTWQAMKEGRQTRHLRQTVQRRDTVSFEAVAEYLDWPCMIFADDGVVEHVPNRGTQWLSAGDYHTFYRNYAWDFENSTRSLMHIDAGAAERLNVIRGLSIDTSAEAILLRAEGIDPQLLLPAFDPQGYHRTVLKVVMTSPEETEMQLFYQTKGQRFYSEEKSMRQSVAIGENILFFPLDLSEMSAPFRLDIAKKPGNYLVSEVNLRGLCPVAVEN